VYKFSFIFFITILSFSCQQKKEKTILPIKKDIPERTVITGEILNYKNKDQDELKFTLNRVGTPRIILDKTIDSLGNFKVEFDCYSPTDYFFSYTNHQLLITTEPGDSTHIIFNGNDKKIKNNFVFSGDHHETNNAIAAFQEYYSNERDSLDEIKRQCLKQEVFSNFKTNAEQLKNENLIFIKTFNQQHHLNKKSKKWIHNHLNNNHFITVSNYTEAKKSPEARTYFHSLLNHLRNDTHYYKGYDLFKKVDLIFDSYYAPLLIDKWQKAINSKKEFNLDSLKIHTAIQNTTKGIVRELLICKLTTLHLEQGEYRFHTYNKDIIQTEIHSAYLKEQLNNSITDILNKSQNKKEFKNQLPVNNTILDDIISNNKGKVIYIDCWATWCAPCREQIPMSLEIKKQFSKDEVAFIYICLKSNKESWQNVSNKLNLPVANNFLIGDKKNEKEFIKYVGLKGYPHYILIDQEGNIVTKNQIQLLPKYISKNIKELL